MRSKIVDTDSCLKVKRVRVMVDAVYAERIYFNTEDSL